MRLLRPVCLSLCPQVTTLVPSNAFWWNFKFGVVTEIYRQIKNVFKIEQHAPCICFGVRVWLGGDSRIENPQVSFVTKVTTVEWGVRACGIIQLRNQVGGILYDVVTQSDMLQTPRPLKVHRPQVTVLHCRGSEATTFCRTRYSCYAIFCSELGKFSCVLSFVELHRNYVTWT
jgi:hypothetical protein